MLRSSSRDHSLIPLFLESDLLPSIYVTSLLSRAIYHALLSSPFQTYCSSLYPRPLLNSTKARLLHTYDFTHAHSSVPRRRFVSRAMVRP